MYVLVGQSALRHFEAVVAQNPGYALLRVLVQDIYQLDKVTDDLPRRDRGRQWVGSSVLESPQGFVRRARHP